MARAVIDVHTHVFLRQFFETVIEDIGIDVPLSETQVQNVSGGWVDLTDIDRRKRMMDEMGIDKQVISFSSIENFIHPKHWDGAETRGQIARMVNDSFAEITETEPEYFGAFADVPLVDGDFVDLAIAEIERAVEDLGFEGVTLNSNYNGVRLDDDRLDPVLETIDALGVPVFMHPSNPAGLSEALLDKFFLPVLIGYPNETALAATRLVLSGAFDRYDLDVIAPHSGGTLPFLDYRIGLSFDTDVPTFYGDGIYADSLEKSAHAYFAEHFYYDTALSSDEQIAYTLDRFDGRAVFGTDTPWFPLDEVGRIVEFVETAVPAETARDTLFSENARALGISV